MVFMEQVPRYVSERAAEFLEKDLKDLKMIMSLRK